VCVELAEGYERLAALLEQRESVQFDARETGAGSLSYSGLIRATGKRAGAG
jgi:hypothetical protein